MILNWVEVSPPAQTSTFAPAQWAPVLLDDPFVDWRRRKPYGLPLLPKNQVRAIGYRATLCFHCAMTALDLEARGMARVSRVAEDAPEAAGMARCTTTRAGSCWPMGAWRTNNAGTGRPVGRTALPR